MIWKAQWKKKIFENHVIFFFSNELSLSLSINLFIIEFIY